MAVLRPEEERAIRELLAEVERPVELALVLGPVESTTLVGAREIDPEVETRRIVAAVAELCERVTVSEHGEGAFGVERHPAIVLLADGAETGARFHGTPWGYELTSLVGAVHDAGRQESALSPASLEQLATLERDVALEVFVTPT